MNMQEWVSFMDDFSARFPSDFEWLDAHPKTQDVWFRDIFSGLGIEDCLQVSADVFRTGQGWAAYERDRIPSHYQAEVGRMRQKRREASRIEGYRKEPRKRRPRMGTDLNRGMVNILSAGDKGFDDGKSMAECYKNCEQMKADGATPEQRAAYVEEYFG